MASASWQSSFFSTSPNSTDLILLFIIFFKSSNLKPGRGGPINLGKYFIEPSLPLQDSASILKISSNHNNNSFKQFAISFKSKSNLSNALNLLIFSEGVL